MKKWLPAIAIAGVAGGLFIFHLQSRVPSVAPNTTDEPRAPFISGGARTKPLPGHDASSGARLSNPSQSENAQAAPAPAISARHDRRVADLSEPEFTNFPPATVLDNMRVTFNQYASMFGGNPVGTNPEITAALNGNNPKGANFIKPETGMRINEKGELVDPWGTPYFFHQLSGTEMEIHSAGPDRVMWTADDLVVK